MGHENLLLDAHCGEQQRGRQCFSFSWTRPAGMPLAPEELPVGILAAPRMRAEARALAPLTFGRPFNFAMQNHCHFQPAPSLPNCQGKTCAQSWTQHGPRTRPIMRDGYWLRALKAGDGLPEPGLALGRQRAWLLSARARSRRARLECREIHMRPRWRRPRYLRQAEAQACRTLARPR